jgi:hypothetical protein
MPLTAGQGFKIREEKAGIKEKEMCDAHNLIWVGGSRTKIDGKDEKNRTSIKQAGGKSTQVHLTTQKHFKKVLSITGNAAEFIHHFCGNADYNYQGKDRRHIPEINTEYVEAFALFLNENTEKIVDLIIRNGDDITSVIYHNTKSNVEYEMTYPEILDKIEGAEWKFLKGGVHLKLNGNTLFHFQREGKKSKSNRYNVLWHIHQTLFV